MKISELHLYTDGACSGNPGPGGWGVVIQDQEATPETYQELYGGESETTNNRMEMMAAIKGLEAVAGKAETIHLHTDSNYLKDGITAWVEKWQRNGWKTAAGQSVKNQDLWEQLVLLNAANVIKWHWVRGHAGHPQNERADFLARHGVMQQIMQLNLQAQMQQA
jgi:RNase HI (EC 3.1.26.4)